MSKRRIRGGNVHRSGHALQYLVRPHEEGAPTFYLRAHTPQEASDKARKRLAGFEENFTCSFDLIPLETRA
jgi:hypothetical protein